MATRLLYKLYNFMITCMSNVLPLYDSINLSLDMIPLIYPLIRLYNGNTFVIQVLQFYYYLYVKRVAII